MLFDDVEFSGSSPRDTMTEFDANGKKLFRLCIDFPYLFDGSGMWESYWENKLRNSYI
jgi:hypothetical protein